MSRQDIAACVRAALEQYFVDLGQEEPRELHALILEAAEKPLLEAVMARAEGNQSRAAQWLGMNRNTLRRKLIEHGIAQ
jgi:Fis family transcriptional regulator